MYKSSEIIEYEIVYKFTQMKRNMYEMENV